MKLYAQAFIMKQDGRRPSLKLRRDHVTPERRTSTLNNATSVISLDTISFFNLIDYQRFWDGSCHLVAMVRIQLTKVICSNNTGTTEKILIKDRLIMFITVVSPQAAHGVQPTAIYEVI